MIEKIQLLRNVGPFDPVNAAQFDLLKLVLIYAENGRGKTTLAAALRSAQTGDPLPILKRQRLGALHPPHIVLRDRTGVITFQDGAWSRTLPDVAVFDDQFVSQNVCSGMELQSQHRQNLHELILGAQGVTLNAELQGHVDAVEQHNRNLKTLQDAIPAAVRRRFTVDAFCALEASADVDDAIEEDLVREQAASANVTTLQTDLATLRAVQARHSPAMSAACRAYSDEKALKTATERARGEARANLDQYRTVIFPTYQNAINQYLRRFGVGFRLDSVSSVNNRGGSSCTYSVVINEVPVSVTAATGPNFRNTLSAGDRNTLALAFFFASLDQDTNLHGKIIVIDDPMSSLDEHRSKNTLHEMLQLLNRVDQMFVLSHSKSFLCALWQDAPRGRGTALRIGRTRDGQNRDASTTAIWNVHADCVSANDQRHELVLGYIQAANPAVEREVAAALRPILEAFMRVAYSTFFPPGALLGPFLNICQQRLGTPHQILNGADIQELERLVDYGNGFHHDSNPAYQTVIINSHELTDFCQRTLAFARRG